MEWLTEGLMVTILGMCTVFLVLIFICLILAVMGYIMKNTEEGKNEEKKTAVKPSPAVNSVNAGGRALNGDTELIAVLTAAIAAYECSQGKNTSPDKLVVRSFRRVNTWNREAIQEQQNNLY